MYIFLISMESQSRLKIFLATGVALLLAAGFFLLIITFIVNPYLDTNEKLTNIFYLYTKTAGDDTPPVYIVGSSQVREDINATVIQEIWNERNLSFEVYNVGYTGDTPLRRLTELVKMRESHPRLVVIGVSYHSFHDDIQIPYEHLLIPSDQILLDEPSRSLFTSTEQQYLSGGSIKNIWEKRIWIIPSLAGLLHQDEQNIENTHNFKDPFIYSVNETDLVLERKIREHPDEQRMYVTFPPDDNRQKKALTYIIGQLRQSGSGVTILIMPLNPLLEQTVSEADYRGMRQFLHSTNVTVVDFETVGDRTDFIDLVHMNSAGREKVSRLLTSSITPGV
jgi:hypothetical protein